MAATDKLFRWAETNSMSVEPMDTPDLRAKLLEKLRRKRIPVVALLKKGRLDWYSNLTRLKTLKIQNVRFSVSAEKKIDSICSCPLRNKLAEGIFNYGFIFFWRVCNRPNFIHKIRIWSV